MAGDPQVFGIVICFALYLPWLALPLLFPQVAVELDWTALPILDGASESLSAGVLSSLHVHNARASSAIANFEQLSASQPAVWPILVDPQTAGGLLAGVPADKADACVKVRVCGAHAGHCLLFIVCFV